MPRILIRAHKNPFTVADAERTFERNLIGNNTGNLVFSQSVYRLLSVADADLRTSGLHKDAPEEINENTDHVVIPLANAFRPDYVDTLDALSRTIEQLRVPVSVLGVGSQASLAGQTKSAEKVAAATTRFVRAVLDRSPSIGVRGEFTRDYLRSLGFGDEHVRVIGCPSMFMFGPDLHVTQHVDALTRESPIAFNVSPYVPEIGPLSLYCAENYPNLVYMGQNKPTLELLLHGTYPMKKSTMVDNGAPVFLQHPLVREGRVRFFLDPTTWFDHLKLYDFSFGTRIHGNIAALLAGIPAVLLAHDSRTLELAAYHEIPHRLITEIAADTDPTVLYAESSWEPLNSGHAARWDVFAAFLASHGLHHVYEPGQDHEEFDRLLAAVPFPPPVETLMTASPEELYALRRSAREAETELADTLTALSKTRAKLAKTETKLAAAGVAPVPAPSSQLRARVWNKLDRTVRRVGRLS